MLGEDRFAVGRDIEDARTALDELGDEPERCRDLGRQTGGPWQVISRHAVDDSYVHRLAPGPRAPCCRWQHAAFGIADDRSIVDERIHLQRTLLIRPIGAAGPASSMGTSSTIRVAAPRQTGAENGRELRSRSAGDVTFELLDQCFLVVDHGLDEIADRYDAEDPRAIGHGQVTDEVLGHYG